MSNEVADRPTALHTTAAGRALLALEAKRLQHAFLYDPVIAMSVSRVDPLPHQIEAVYGHVLKMPRIRFMLAHDPGAGKTIMAGLIIKELKLRGAATRILIVVPGHLKEQWRWEMKDKMDEDFEVVDRESFNQDGAAYAWDGNQIITSIDFAKREDVLASLNSSSFDIVVVDEAHKMSAYSYGRTTSKTKRYRLGEVLSATSKHLLFLTATPHKGDTSNFRLLMDLLEPGFFAGREMIEESIKNRDNPLFLRRAKEGMTDFDGSPLFVQRSVMTPDVHMSPAEKTLYNAMSRYVREQYNLASRSSKGHNVTFALIILQRRFASSPYALLKSLLRRKARLEDLLKSGGRPDSDLRKQTNMESAEEMSEQDRWAEEEKWEVLSTAQSREDLQEEIGTINKIISKTEKVLKKGSETKLTHLKDTMQEIDRSQPGEKMLVFTESKDTMSYLAGRVREWGYSVSTIHGAMSSTERREAEVEFRDKTRVMVATEAAGEGINLQFCHLMVNYDLPWNPNRLEQRMGRIHRYGQKHPVHVFNLVASDTREGEIMQRLFEKLEIIKDAMGSDKIFDVISEVIPGKSFSGMLLDATVRARKQNAIIAEIDGAVNVNNERIRDYLKDGLAAKYVDYTMFEDVRKGAAERSLVPEYTAGLFARVLEAAGGSVSDADGASSSSSSSSVTLPPPIENLALDKYDMQRTVPAGRLNSVTFDKRIRMANPGMELVTFGHPAFDAALDWAEREYSEDAKSGVTLLDPLGRIDGYVVYCQADVTDGAGDLVGSHLSAFVVEAGAAREVSPAVLLDLKPYPTEQKVSAIPQDIQDLALSESAKLLDVYTDHIAAERNRYADTVQKYGMRSLDTLLDGINDDIVRLLGKKRKGGKVDLAIYNKREERKRYKSARKALDTRTKADVKLDVNAPAVMGAVRVVPDKSSKSKARHALVSAMEFEKTRGMTPEDVSGTGRGFDIRSSGGEAGTRYVLARQDEANVYLTQNEWMRSKTLGIDSYLYLADKEGNIVCEVANPAAVLPATKTISGYMLDAGRAVR